MTGLYNSFGFAGTNSFDSDGSTFQEFFDEAPLSAYSSFHAMFGITFSGFNGDYLRSYAWHGTDGYSADNVNLAIVNSGPTDLDRIARLYPDNWAAGSVISIGGSALVRDVATAPEPGIWLLFASSLLGLLISSRRRKII